MESKHREDLSRGKIMEEVIQNNTNKILTNFKKIHQLKYWPLLLGLLVLLICYISYFALAIWQAIPDFAIYEPTTDQVGADYIFFETIQFIAKNWVIWPIQFVMGLSLAILAIITTILLLNRKLTWKKAIILVLIAGAIMRIGYGLYTDNIVTRQHDVWRDETYTGHYGITMYIYYNWKTPFPLIVDGQYSLDSSYQLYHPKFAHWTMALFMHFNSLFMGNNDFVLYEANRILTTFLSIIGMYLCYRLINETTLSDSSKFIAICIITFCPMFYRLSAMSNNDPFVIFFMIFTIYFTFRWTKNHSFLNIILIAIGIGLAMSSKLSGALISILSAIMFLIVLIQVITKKDTSIKLHKLIIQFIVFAVIVFPLGLFWPLFAYINYNQPVLYVWTSLSKNIAVKDGVTWFDKYAYFNFYQYFHHPYMVLWNTNTACLPQDYNIYDAMLKSSLFGEFSYNSKLFYLAYLFLTINLLIGIAFSILSIYMVVKFIYCNIKNHENNIKKNYLSNTIIGMAFLFFIFLINYIIFTAKNPYLCSYDFRYIVPIIIPFGYFIGLGLDKLNTSRSINLTKYTKYSTLSIVLLLSVLSCAFYCLI